MEEDIVTEWERDNDQPYLYAGRGRGADVAAWKQAVSTELAAMATTKVAYGQALLDFVKVFDRIPHRFFAEEAAAFGVPFRFVNLSIATYRLARVFRIGETISKQVWAFTGIAAGFGFVCTDMRVVFTRMVDKSCTCLLRILPTFYVDDHRRIHGSRRRRG